MAPPIPPSSSPGSPGAHVREGDGVGPGDAEEDRAGGEGRGGGEGPAGTEGGGEADEEALAGVERERRVDRLARLDAEEPGERDPAHGEAEVAYDGRLRIAGRPGRINVEEDVAAADVGDVGLGGDGALAPALERADVTGECRAGRRVGEEADGMARSDQVEGGEGGRV